MLAYASNLMLALSRQAGIIMSFAGAICYFLQRCVVEC